MMSQNFMKFNPGFRSDEDILKEFLARQADFHLIMETIAGNTHAQANQHLLLVGPRGMGKTTLVVRAAAEVRRSGSPLAEWWHPIVFAEEAYPVRTAGEFWLEALYHLAHQPGNDKWLEVHEELLAERDEERLRDRTVAKLMDFADNKHKRLLLIVENVQMLFDEQLSSDDAWVLRHTLQNEPRIMLLATATTRFQQIEGANEALFDLFRIQDLQPLNDEECRRFWQVITGLELRGKRIRPVRILTGGNPRLLAIVARFAAQSSFTELMGNLLKLVDDHTDYFKSHLDSLAPLERKVFVTLAELWDPSPAREVARVARIDVSKASSELLRLTSKGAVIAEEGKRFKKYQVAERMYNIYYLMRRRGDPAARMQALVRFMVSFYQGEELIRTTSMIAREAMLLSPSQQGEHLVFLQELLRSVENPLLQQRLWEVAESCLKAIDAPAREEMASETMSPATTGIDIADLVHKIEELETDPSRAKQVEEELCKATELSPQDPRLWEMLGFVRAKFLDLSEAETALRKALDLQPNNVIAWVVLGISIASMDRERAVEAEAAFRKAIELEPNSAWAWHHLALLLGKHLGRFEEAERAWRTALEIEPNNSVAWQGLGDLLWARIERFAEAEEAYRKAVELEPESPDVWHKLGVLLASRRHFEEAEAPLRKALELAPDSAMTLAVLGFSLLMATEDRDPDIEGLLRKAVEIEPLNPACWTPLGTVLHRMKRFAEAEAVYQRSIELQSDRVVLSIPWSGLARLMMADTGRPEEGLAVAEQLLSRTGRSAMSLHDLAWYLYCSGNKKTLPQAEEWIREAIEKEPEAPDYLLTAALIFKAQGKWQEILDLLPRMLASAVFIEKHMSDYIDVFVGLAAGGYGAEALAQLQTSSGASVLEPLIWALRLDCGEEISVAQEIHEVAKDIVSRIEELRKELAEKRA